MNNAKTYNVPRDSSASNVGESLSAYSVGKPEQIVLTIPRDRDAEAIRSRVNEFYLRLLEETADEAHFMMLRNSWEMETGVLSNPGAITASPSFKEIVRMGQKAVPYILRDIALQPSLLFVALEKIYSTHLATPTKNGKWLCIDVKESCRLWVEHLTK